MPKVAKDAFHKLLGINFMSLVYDGLGRYMRTIDNLSGVWRPGQPDHRSHHPKLKPNASSRSIWSFSNNEI